MLYQSILLSTAFAIPFEIVRGNTVIKDEHPKAPFTENKELWGAALKRMGASTREAHFGMAAGMQETGHFLLSELDKTKTGDSENFGILNQNRAQIRKNIPGLDPQSLEGLSPEALDNSAKVFLVGLRRQGEAGWVREHSGGSSGTPLDAKMIDSIGSAATLLDKHPENMFGGIRYASDIRNH